MSYIFSNRTYPNPVRHGRHFYACAARTEYEINLRGAPYELVPGYFVNSLLVPMTDVGAQWLSGRVLDSRPKGRGFESHRRHCVVVLEQDTFILA